MSTPPIVWSPEPGGAGTRIAEYVAWLRAGGVAVSSEDPEGLWRWSIEHLDDFWMSLWRWFDVDSPDDPTRAIEDPTMPGARWFGDARINLAAHALRRSGPEPAIIARSQTRPGSELSWDELADAVGRVRAGLAGLGVRPGDRVAAYLPNIPETIVAFLACAGLGAVWTCCAPEFGTTAVLDRFSQVDPVVLIAVDGYRYGDRVVDRLADVETIRDALPGLRHVVHVPYLHPGVPAGRVGWDELVAEASPVPGPLPVPCSHPLWIVFSSGTTGLPKALVHGHVVLLEYLKTHAILGDLGPGDRLFWYTTTGWIMWNYLATALLVGASVVCFDGDPTHPDPDGLWRVAAEEGVKTFGVGAGALVAAARSDADPAADHDFSSLRILGSTGSPLPAEVYRWVADRFDRRVMVNSISGGTDVCGAFVGGSPLLPVYAGEISGRCLGIAVEAFDPAGRPVVGEEGELVVTAPIPSMPLALWGDGDGSAMRAAYFDTYPGVWRHGDWITITERGTCIISGRSDATLNRGGVRIGTAEVYRVVEAVAGVADSLVVHLEDAEPGGPGRLVLLVALEGSATVPVAEIAAALRSELSPRHVPDEFHAVPAIPTTITGKKLEVPVKRILLGADPEAVASRAALRDPGALDAVVEVARSRG